MFVSSIRSGLSVLTLCHMRGVGVKEQNLRQLVFAGDHPPNYQPPDLLFMYGKAALRRRFELFPRLSLPLLTLFNATTSNLAPQPFSPLLQLRSLRTLTYRVRRYLYPPNVMLILPDVRISIRRVGTYFPTICHSRQ